MLLRKSRMIGIVLLANAFLIPTAVAAPAPDITLADAVAAMVTYLTRAANDAKIAADALRFMSPPGSTDVAKNVGVLASTAESTLNNKLMPKELADINWALYSTPRPGERVAGNPFNNFIKNHTDFFCAPSSGVESALDNAACGANAGSATNQYGDIKASSLLVPTIYDPRQQILAEEVIRNLTSPFPNNNVTDLVSGGLGKSEDKKYVAQIMAKQAAITIARNSLNEIYGARLAEVAPVSPPKAASVMSVMEDEAGRRFKKADWYDTVQQSSNEALLRELVHMESYRLWTDYHRYRQNERIEALLATMVSVLADQSLQILDASPRK